MRSKMKWFITGMAVAGLFMWFCITSIVHGGELKDIDMLRACIGEAESEPQIGKVAVLEVIRTRGSMNGIYGYKAIVERNGGYYRKNRRIADLVILACRDAVESSKNSNITKGAKYFENVGNFGWPAFTKGHRVIVTSTIKNHVFYRLDK